MTGSAPRSKARLSEITLALICKTPALPSTFQFLFEHFSSRIGIENMLKYGPEVNLEYVGGVEKGATHFLLINDIC